MNLLKYIFGKTQKSFKAPDNWGEVPYHIFEKFQTQKDLKPSEVYSLFLQLDKEYWEKAHDPKLYESINGQLAFLSEEPKIDKLPKKLIRKDNIYKVHKDIMNVSADKYWSILELSKQITEKSNNELEILPQMVAVFCCENLQDSEEFEDTVKDVRNMPTDLVYSLGTFFLQKLHESRSGTQKNWKRDIIKKTLFTIRLVTTILLSSLVVFILFIIKPKVTLQSTKEFIKRQYERFTGRYRYKVASINPKDYTLI